jgi:hypothetical protein
VPEIEDEHENEDEDEISWRLGLTSAATFAEISPLATCKGGGSA